LSDHAGDDLPAYCSGLIDTALTRLPPPDRSHPNEKPYQGRVEEHVQLLGIARQISQILARDPRIIGNASPTIMHPDLHLHNIFVDPDDPTTTTAFIDWQGTSIEPAFEHAGMVLDLETTQLHFPGKRNSEGDSHRVLERAYDAFVRAYIPRLAAVRTIDDDLLRLFRYCHRTWVDGITVLRDELINLSTWWEEFGLPSPCPYTPPSGRALQDHEKDHQLFLQALELKESLTDQLQTTKDGWIQSELWDETQENYTNAFMTLSEDISQPDSDMTIQELEAIWPFDKPITTHKNQG
jgi:Ser/Thr protein kinase RdoA (MazF antagonist)